MPRDLYSGANSVPLLEKSQVKRQCHGIRADLVTMALQSHGHGGLLNAEISCKHLEIGTHANESHAKCIAGRCLGVNDGIWCGASAKIPKSNNFLPPSATSSSS